MDLKQSKFEAIVNAYSADLYQYAYWLCRNQALAEDLVQESYMRAWKAIDQLNDEKKMKAWLMTIVRRENARHFSGKQQQEVSLEEIEFNNDPSFHIEQNEIDHIHLRRALFKISTDYAEPLVLQVLGGYTSQEIAEIMEISPAAVMTRLFRARQQLKKWLEKGETANSHRNKS